MTVRANAPDLKALARDLKAAGRKDLQKELYAGLNRATKPLRADIKEHARDILPSGGGLNERVARATISVRGGGGRVRLVARPSKRGGEFNPERLNAGVVDHPTYGHKPTIKGQRVKQGWFNDPIIDGFDDVVDELLDGIEKVAADLAAG